MSEESEIVIFYSWQSDLPKTTNLQAIRNALRVASSNVESSLAGQNISIKIDEATKRTSGSPNIPTTILAKIAASDMFICDVTPIYRAKDGHPKSSANPNVIFELGYAVAQLGWDRVVLLFNKEFGTFPADLPFDFDRHRASSYGLSESTAPNKGSDGALVTLLTDAIRAIIRDAPKRPSELRQLDPDEIRRHRDLQNLRRLLENIHWPTLEEHIEEAPKIMQGRVLHFFEGFRSVRRAQLFHLFDEDLLRLVDSVYSAWSRTTRYGARYERVPGGDHYVFSVPPNRAWTEQEEKAWDAIEKARKELHKAIENFLRYLRKHYIEIDIDDLNSVAWRRYVQFRDDFDKSISNR